jgi:hypothetical protein
MKTRARLPQSENLVFIYVLRNAPVEPRATTFSYRIVDRESDQFVAASPLTEQKDLHLVFTLGSRSRHVFMTVTDGDPSRAAAILAQAEDYDASVSRLGLGDTLALNDPYMQQNLREAILFVRPIVSNAISAFADSAEVAGNVIHFLLAVFLDHAEYETKKLRGLEALFDRFRSEGKDLARMSAHVH